MSILFLLAQAAAPAAVAAAPASAAPAPPQGVVSYPASYFAASNISTAFDMVQRIPDFSLDTGSGVRGFEAAAGNVLIDGERPASKSDALDAILQRIPAAQVARIDVIRGGAPGIDMQGKTVIANVIRKKGGSAHGVFAIANQHVDDGRNLGQMRLEGGGSLPGGRTWELGFHGGGGLDDGIGPGHNNLVFADGRTPQLARLETFGTGLSGQFTGAFETPLAGGRLRINGFVQPNKFREPETDFIFSPAPDVQRFRYVQKTLDTEAGGRFNRAFGANTDLELVVLRTSRKRKTDSASTDADPSVTGADASNDFFNERRSSELILRGSLKHRFGQALSVEAIVENADNKLDTRTSFIENQVQQALPAANVKVEEKRTEGYFKLAWRPLASLNLDGQIGYETSDISSRGDVVLAKTLEFAKPRLALAWTPRAGTQVRFRVEREVGQLNFDDFVGSSNLTTAVGVTAGNPNLNPETDWVYWVDVEQQMWKGSSILLSARHFDISDVIDRGPVFAPDGTVFDQPTNIGDGTKDALEATVTLRFDTFGWKGALLKADYLRRWSKVTDPTTHEKREISGIHPADWSVNFSQDLPTYHASVGFDLFGGWRQTSYRFNLVETVKLKSYFQPFAEWKPRPDFSVRLELPLINHPQVRLRDTLKIFPGPRSLGGAPDIQERTFTFPYAWFIRVRKEFD